MIDTSHGIKTVNVRKPAPRQLHLTRFLKSHCWPVMNLTQNSWLTQFKDLFYFTLT